MCPGMETRDHRLAANPWANNRDQQPFARGLLPDLQTQGLGIDNGVSVFANLRDLPLGDAEAKDVDIPIWLSSLLEAQVASAFYKNGCAIIGYKSLPIDYSGLLEVLKNECEVSC